MLYQIARILVGLTVVLCLPVRAEAPQTTLAIAVFQKNLSKFSKFPITCFSFDEEGPVKGESDMDVTVRGINNRRCGGGDPNVSPRMTTLRVLNYQVYYEDVVNGTWIPLN